MVRQELTSGWVTSRLGKPHPEQDQIEGRKGAQPYPWVSRLTPIVMSGRDRWSPSRFSRDTEFGLQVYLANFQFALCLVLFPRQVLPFLQWAVYRQV